MILSSVRFTVLVDVLEFAVEWVVISFWSFGVVVEEGVKSLGEEIVSSDVLPIYDSFS